MNGQGFAGEVILIADRLFCDYESLSATGINLEKVTDKYFNDVYPALQKNFQSVTVYSSPKELIDNLPKHKNPVVFSIYGGEVSRNRLVLVQAICEAYGVPYVGSDPYFRFICQDKKVCKDYTAGFGLYGAKDVIVHSEADIPKIQGLRLPLVVKPNMEGSSIGIDEDSFVHDFATAERKIKECLQLYSQDVLVEEFLPGREISVCIAGTKDKVHVIEAVELFAPDVDDFFENNLYTVNIKLYNDVMIDYRVVTDIMPEEVMEKCKRMFFASGKVDYLRIDGKLHNGQFDIIELTPDAHIGSDSVWQVTFAQNGISYPDMFRDLINIALDRYKVQA